MKNWEKRALELLDKSLTGVPHELNELDWKESLSPNHGKLSCHLSAFANTPGGGFIAFGIDNKTRLPIGITAHDCEQIITTLTNRARETLNPAVLLEHSHILYQEHNLLMLFIHESPTKPVHIKSGTIEDSYIRSGGSTRKASRNEVGGLLLNSHLPRWEELHATLLLSESEVLGLLDFHAIHQLLKRPVPSTNKEILHWLETEKMVKRSNDSGYYITNVGAIAAARNLNAFNDLGRKTIRVIRYKGLNKLITEKEFPGEKGYAIGFYELIQFIRASLPQSEVIRDALRHEEAVYPEIALRELIANALIHQDFTVHGKNPMIEIFDDRLEITNPGTLMPSKNIDRLIGTSPESRNEVLAQAFRRFHICEERGSGFTKTINAIELSGLPPLKFEQGENYFKVILSSPRKFADMSREERIQACYQHAVIKHLSNSAMTNTTLRGRFKMHEKQRAMISRLIKDALAAKTIKTKDASNKSNKYMEYLPYWA
jgi:ATP-dependent DNA helicase RecG